MADARTKRVVKAIQDYLSQNPDAADSERGIAEWWLPAAGVEASAEEIAAALEHLEELGVVERHRMPDGRLIYRAGSGKG